MFGYVKPFIPEMKMREYELYRAIYCGLCRSMGSYTGQLSRFTLNYDYVFLAAIRFLASGATPTVSKKCCIAHPLKKRTFVHDCEELRYSAAVSAFLAEGKVSDDLSDERGFGRLRVLLISPAVRGMVRKARRQENGAKSSVRELIPPPLAELSRLERENSPSIDETAEVFGVLLGKLFSEGLPPREGRIAYEVGRGIGRFIYVADACDDVCDDLTRGRYNPILSLYGDGAVEERDGKLYLSQKAAESIYVSALLDLERCAGAAELLCDGGNGEIASIVRNVLYLGMPEVLKGILKKRSGRNVSELSRPTSASE